MSFGFTPVSAPFSEDGSTRTLNEVRLHEVSPVSGWPAYAATSATVRAIAEAADMAPDALADAFAALRVPEQRLTPDQRDLLVALINTRSDAPVIAARIATWRETFAAKAATL